MVSRWCRVVAIVLVGGAFTAAQSRGDVQPEGKDDATVEIAKKPEDLALALIQAVCKNDVETIQQYMPTDEVMAQIAPPKGREQFRIYRDSFVPRVVKGLHEELSKQDATDPKAWKVAGTMRVQEMQSPAGTKLQTTQGVRVSNGTIFVEIVDRGLGVDGRWYVVNFCTEKDSTQYAGESFPEFAKRQAETDK